MICPYESETNTCKKFDLMPCVGVNNCAFINGSNNLLQGIQTPYEELKARAEKAEGELKAIKARIEAVKPDLEEIYYELDKHSYDDWTLSVLDITEKIIKQIGGVK